MTDNDVIKGLEAFNGYTIVDLAIDLIKRQKAEIERLKSYKNLYEDLKAENLETIKSIKTAETKAIKEFAEEIINDILPRYTNGHEEIALRISFAISQKTKEMTEERK